MKKILSFIIVGVVLVSAFFWFNNYIYTQKQNKGISEPPHAPISSYKDATYRIEGYDVKLTNGVAEEEAAPGSVSKINTRYFGNEVTYDFNHDGRQDVVFLLTQESGGSGLFYYVVGALATATGYQGSEAFLLGDRIAPQTTGIESNGRIVVNYADRKPDEGFTISPSVATSTYLVFDTSSMQLVEQHK